MSKKEETKINEENEALEEEVKEENAEETSEEPKAEETKTEDDEWKNKYVRILADFDNFKKRTQKEMTGSFTNGVSTVVEQLLPVMDNFDRAILAIDDSDDSNLAQGVNMIYKQLGEVFEKLGVKPVEALGKQFDPNFHNAVMHIDDENYGENEVVEEFMKGYTLKDKVIRHSMVKVAN